MTLLLVQAILANDCRRFETLFDCGRGIAAICSACGAFLVQQQEHAMWTAEHRERYKDDGRRYLSDLTDAEWEAIAPYFAVYPTLTADLREMVNACLYLHKTGCGWRYLPKDFGPWETVIVPALIVLNPGARKEPIRA